MNKYHLFSLLCLILGIVFFAFGILSGNVDAGVVVIIPFLAGSGVYAFLGFIFVFFAILLFMFSFTSSVKLDNFQDGLNEQQSSRKTLIKGGGVVLIGPIPIVFGSNWKIAIVLMILAIIIIIITFLFFRFF
jgi:uncharacterized protein (TIGR00304 family)